uniref:Uncharacterized protein n=1 Tax=Micrurus corallinus TaxID=54390 RepID=A0A2D4ER10_MICCO
MTWMTDNLCRHLASKERKKALAASQGKDVVQQCRGISFGAQPPELWNSWKAPFPIPDYTTAGKLNVDVENQLLDPLPNGSASEQEKEPGTEERVVVTKASKRRQKSG